MNRKSKAMSTTRKTKRWKQDQSATMIAATSSTILERPNHIAKAIMASSVKFSAIFYNIKDSDEITTATEL